MTGDLTLNYGYPRINFYDSNHDSDYSLINNDGSFSLYDITNNVHRWWVTSGGNVGIGTTNPTQRLSVAGNTDLGNSVGSTLSSTHTTKISGYAMRYDASNRYGNYGVLILNSDSGWTASARKFMLTSGLNTNKFAIIRSVDADTDPAFGDGGVISSGTADFVIDNSGNIGIGNTGPSYKLDVDGIARTSGLYFNGGFRIFDQGQGYATFNDWVNLPGAHGFYSGINNAHIYPNNGSYGSWRIQGSRNNYRGLEFGSGVNGDVSLMIHENSNITGFHNNSYGWQFRWENGTLYCDKNSYGGGTSAVVLDSSNYTSYALPISGGNATGWVSFSSFTQGTPIIKAVQQDTDAGYYLFQGVTGSSEVFRVDRNGNLVLNGAITASGYNKSNWDTAYGWGNHATANYWSTSSPDPQIIAAGSVTFQYDVEVQGTFSETSARRYKENIVDLEPVTDKVYALRPVRYNKIGSETQEIGLIAEEVAELFPEVVHYNDEGQPESLNYTRLSVLLLQTVKELSERIQKLENK